MELLHHPSEGNFKLPDRLHPQLRQWAKGHYDVSRKFKKLRGMFPGKLAEDPRIFDQFIQYYTRLYHLLPFPQPDKGEDPKVKSILYSVAGFSGHDIAHLTPYQWQGNAGMYLSNPSVHFPRILDALDNFADCTEGVGAFLSPDEIELSSYDLAEVLARNFRKIQLRNQNYIHDPSSGFTKDEDREMRENKKKRREKFLKEGISDARQSEIYNSDFLYKKGTSEELFDSVEFDLRNSTTGPALIEKGNRGVLFLIIYNIIKNGYKMIQNLPDYSLSLEALYRDVGKDGINDREKESLRKEINKLQKENEKNRLFREEIERNGGKLKISAEIVDADDALVVHIWDNAAGFDLNGIKKWIKDMAATDYAKFLEVCLDPLLPAELRNGLEAWQTNPYMSGIISAHMPEFIKLARFSQHGSSGLGLFGAEVLAQKLGGGVLAAEMINGGAFFSIIVPKDTTKWIGKPENMTREHQRKVASRVLPVLGKDRKAA